MSSRVLTTRGMVVLKGLIDVPYDKASKLARVVDLDVDIGADAVDYKYVISRLAWVPSSDTVAAVLLPTRSHCQVWRPRCANWKE